MHELQYYHIWYLTPCSEEVPRESLLAEHSPTRLCIPESMSRQLNLAAECARPVTLDDGRSIEAPYVGPVRAEVAGRTCFVGAMVFGDEVLLGSMPMEDLELMADPARRQVVPRDPRDPGGPVSLAKGFSVK